MSWRIVEEALVGMPGDLTTAERLTLIVLAHHADEKTRECWPGAKLLRERTGLHDESVRRAIKRLVERGLVTRVGGHPMTGRRAVYRVDSPHTRQALSETGPVGNSPSPESSLPLHSVGDSPHGKQGPFNQEPKEPSSAREEQPMRQNDPTPSDEALAVFSQSHPGREREALRAALAWYERKNGRPCTAPARYFGAWPGEHLASTFKLAAAARPPCPECNGAGFLEDPKTLLPVRSCPTCKPRRVSA